MFANVTLQDILTTLQAPPPEMQAAPGFAQLLQYSEADWSQWLEKLQQLDAEGQDLAALPADFLLLPESDIDRQAVQGMHFLELDATAEDAADTPDSAMAMLAALLYQPEVEATPVAGAAEQQTQTAVWAMRTRTVDDAPVASITPGTQTTLASMQARAQAATKPDHPPSQPAYSLPSSSLGPALGLMASMTPPIADTPQLALQVQDHDLDAAGLTQALQTRMATPANPSTPATPPTPVLQPHSPAFAQQMQQQVQFMLRQDMKQMDVRLDPPELGAMKIHLKLDNGLTHVQIITATAEARDLLHASQAHIREALPVAQGQLQLDIRQHAGGQFGMQAEGQAAGQPGSGSDGPAAEAESVVETPVQRWTDMPGGQGLVDTFV